jgi:hypothetical protein
MPWLLSMGQHMAEGIRAASAEPRRHRAYCPGGCQRVTISGMCCDTHHLRDVVDMKTTGHAHGVLVERADPFRCLCRKVGDPCMLRATGEDKLCDWCRGRDHQKTCYELYELLNELA